MAQIRLATSELDRDSMPEICAVCGADSVTCMPWKVSTRPRWLIPVAVVLFIAAGLPGILLVMLISAAVTKRKTVELPLCETCQRKRTHRKWLRGIATVLLFLAVATVIGAVVTIAMRMDSYERRDDPTPVIAMIAGLIATLVFAGLAMFFGRSPIKAGKITPRSVLLIGVHEEFVEGVRDERAAYFEEFERTTPDEVPKRPHPELRDWDEDL